MVKRQVFGKKKDKNKYHFEVTILESEFLHELRANLKLMILRRMHLSVYTRHSLLYPRFPGLRTILMHRTYIVQHTIPLKVFRRSMNF